tara:strand:- start:7991 stop:8467 length:477 start_codon:yes stop_codon:yes gene_type:complete
MNAVVRDFKQSDVKHLAKNLRHADKQELYATFGNHSDIQDVLDKNVAVTTDAKVIEYKGKPIGVFGVADGHEENFNLGWVWMVGTDDIKEIRTQFLKQCKEELEKMQSKYDVLCNYVDARNKVHIKWLRWMGFTFLREVENYGEESKTFYEFARLSNV